MLLEELANELVDVTSSLMGGRIINIMDTEGMIVASSDPSRVGTFHQGAYQAVKTGKMVSIQKDELNNYPGAREGCNMPLRVSGSIIGAVGLHGNPSEITDLAHLLEVYAAKYYQAEAMSSPYLAEVQLRSRLLRYLLFPTESAVSKVNSLKESLKFSLEPPFTVLIASMRSGQALSSQNEALISELRDKKLLMLERDIWGTIDDRIVILLCDIGTAMRKYLASGPKELEQYRFSISAAVKTLWEIPNAYIQASTLDNAFPAEYNDIKSIDRRCCFMLNSTVTAEQEFISELYNRLCRAFSPEEQMIHLKTAQCYYQCCHSVTNAAKQLFIHKNTLQYRIKHLYDVLGLSEYQPFEQEYTIRLLLEFFKRKQGLRTLI